VGFAGFRADENGFGAVLEQSSFGWSSARNAWLGFDHFSLFLFGLQQNNGGGIEI